MQTSEDKTVADFVRFCYFDDENREPELNADSYIMQFCQLVRMALRNGDDKEYVLDVLKVTSLLEEDLDHGRNALKRLLKQPKYNHLNGIDFVRKKMGVSDMERAAVQYMMGESSDSDFEPEASVESGMVVDGSKNLNNILKDADIKKIQGQIKFH